MSNLDIIRELNRVKCEFQLRALTLAMGLDAQADTHPQGGDAQQAPFMSGTVPACGDAPMTILTTLKAQRRAA